MKQFYITLAMLATFFFHVPNTYACRFSPDLRPFDARIADYDTAFIGKVLNTKSEEGTGNTDAEFLVLAPIKGGPVANDSVKITSRMGSCSRRFEADEIWLITTKGTKKPYVTDVTDASTLIYDNRGLPVAGWAAVTPALSADALALLSKNDACVPAILALADYFDALPHQCTEDKDCGGHFINPFPCQRAVIARGDAMPQDTKPLEELQKSARTACPLKTELVPPCEPTPFNTVCDQGMCKDKQFVTP